MTQDELHWIHLVSCISIFNIPIRLYLTDSHGVITTTPAGTTTGMPGNMTVQTGKWFKHGSEMTFRDVFSLTS